ncbi:FkbM family methyltransferase, partial [Acidimicrobiia bacterium]|nr:FkbM family methyltransferase [Acidimicrobiia bacterium]
QSSLIEDNSFIGEEVEKIIVNTIRLDKYIVEKQIEKINLLKLDVEGYELNSLKSLGEYLNQENIEIIKVEIHFQKGDNFGSINEILNKNGFYLDGFTNTKYLKGEILFVDAYYSAKGLN